jgi:hypothetical protein
MMTKFQELKSRKKESRTLNRRINSQLEKIAYLEEDNKAKIK